MGSDKGLLKLHTSTWAQTAFDKINSFQLPVVISINKNQYAGYSSIFSPQLMITDDDMLQMHGPLCGVLSVHLKYPQEDMLILASDMPLMETDLINELLTQYNTQKENDAFIFKNDGEPEPLCGIYKANALAHIYELYKTNNLRKHSMKYMLEHISTYSILLPENKKKCFRNFNTHAEINGL